MKEVWLATYTHRHGEDVTIHKTLESANKMRREIAKENWDSEIDDSIPKPEHDAELANRYFEIMGNRDNHSEFFEIGKMPVLDN